MTMSPVETVCVSMSLFSTGAKTFSAPAELRLVQEAVMSLLRSSVEPPPPRLEMLAIMASSFSIRWNSCWTRPAGGLATRPVGERELSGEVASEAAPDSAPEETDSRDGGSSWFSSVSFLEVMSSYNITDIFVQTRKTIFSNN